MEASLQRSMACEDNTIFHNHYNLKVYLLFKIYKRMQAVHFLCTIAFFLIACISIDSTINPIATDPAPLPSLTDSDLVHLANKLPAEAHGLIYYQKVLEHPSLPEWIHLMKSNPVLASKALSDRDARLIKFMPDILTKLIFQGDTASLDIIWKSNKVVDWESQNTKLGDGFLVTVDQFHDAIDESLFLQDVSLPQSKSIVGFLEKEKEPIIKVISNPSVRDLVDRVFVWACQSGNVADINRWVSSDGPFALSQFIRGQGILVSASNGHYQIFKSILEDPQTRLSTDLVNQIFRAAFKMESSDKIALYGRRMLGSEDTKVLKYLLHYNALVTRISPDNLISAIRIAIQRHDIPALRLLISHNVLMDHVTSDALLDVIHDFIFVTPSRKYGGIAYELMSNDKIWDLIRDTEKLLIFEHSLASGWVDVVKLFLARPRPTFIQGLDDRRLNLLVKEAHFSTIETVLSDSYISERLSATTINNLLSDAIRVHEIKIAKVILKTPKLLSKLTSEHLKQPINYFISRLPFYSDTELESAIPVFQLFFDKSIASRISTRVWIYTLHGLINNNQVDLTRVMLAEPHILNLIGGDELRETMSASYQSELIKQVLRDAIQRIRVSPALVGELIAGLKAIRH